MSKFLCTVALAFAMMGPAQGQNGQGQNGQGQNGQGQNGQGQNGQGQNGQGQNSQRLKGSRTAPEIDPSQALCALTLLAGGILVVRRKR